MAPLLVILSLLALLLCGLGLVYWTLVAVRLFSGLRSSRSVREGLELEPPAGGWPRLSVVIPAHNEQRVIEAAVRGLRAQDYPELEVIFVLDRCTDRTAELLRAAAAGDPRIIVIENDHCPEGWAGKCNAARVGAERATGQWLLFSDADTIFDPRLCRATVARALHGDVHMITLLSTLTCDRWHELAAQPVACFTLLHMYPLERSSRSRPPRPFANGQFMLFRRDWYERIDGHGGVRDVLLEDLEFARRLLKAGGRGEVLIADGLMRCSMYDSMRGFSTGWERIFMDACKRRPHRLRRHGLRVLTTGLLLPVVQLAALVLAGFVLAHSTAWLAALLALVAVASLVLQVLVLRTVYRVIGAPSWAVTLFPIGSWHVGTTLLRTVRHLRRRRPITWGGRQYVPEPRWAGKH